jgi:CRP/FNR family cyclic AMP-dependent transcriptional regulator
VYTLQADPYGRETRESASSAEWAEVLSEFPFFSKVGKRRLVRLVRHATFAEYAPGDFVIGVGMPADSLQVVLGGSAHVVARPAARPLRTGDVFGELALLGGTARTATVVAASDLHVMRIPAEAFFDLVRKEPDLLLELATMLGTQFIRLEGKAA